MATLLFASDGRLHPLWRYLLAAGYAFTVNLFALFVVSAFHPATLPAFESAYRPMVAVLLLAGFTLLARTADRAARPLGYMGFTHRSPLEASREFLLGLGIGGAMVGLCVAAIVAGGSYQVTLNFGAWAWKLALVELWILLCGALGEELAFRGYPFQRLLEAFPPGVAIVVSSALFAAVHLGNPGIGRVAYANTLLIGALFSLAYLRRRNLWLVWGMHFGWNVFLGMVFGLPVSGFSEFSVIVTGAAQGPWWLTGGSYGIEGGVVATVVIVAAAPCLWLLPRRETYLQPEPPSAPESGI